MKERDIIMSGPMVLAILEGRKSQTRRIIKPEIDTDLLNVTHPAHSPFQGADGLWRWMSGVVSRGENDRRCPYGGPRDRLYVKETHWRFGKWVKNGLTKAGRQAWRFKADESTRDVFYYATEDMSRAATPARHILGWHKRPSIFMPKWATRIWLEITGVRVERLQEISEEDAKAEGFPLGPEEAIAAAVLGLNCPAKIGFGETWDSLHGKDARWEKNPFVWILEFKRIVPV